MRYLNILLLTLVLSSCVGLFADEAKKKGEPENSIAVMSDEVIRVRLAALGYEPLQIIKANPLRYQVQAIKDGKVVVLDFHPQLGIFKPFNVYAPNTTMDLMPKEFTPASK